MPKHSVDLVSTGPVSKHAGRALHRFWRIVLFAAALFQAETVSAEQNQAWILIETGSMTLSVLQNDSVKQVYGNISIGRGGATQEKKRRDGKTPLGKFRIVRITTDSPFHRFFGLDYPDRERIERARQSGVISESEYAAIRRAFRTGAVPPQDTPLGGYIGIHGIGEGDTAIHEDFNWTYGCIALTNAQIDNLSKWVYLGMRVVIRR